MARCKIYLELSRTVEAFGGQKLFNVKRVIDTTRCYPGDTLKEREVKDLVNSPMYEVIIDKAR